jgi:putative membrane protein insertion efficiency factor
VRGILIAALLFYRRYMSPYIGGGCRFTPSCSGYALECIRRHGALSGIRLTWARIGRCRPDHPCGRDPVPARGQIHTALRGRLFVEQNALCRKTTKNLRTPTSGEQTEDT